jgi:hypothetical protein
VADLNGRLKQAFFARPSMPVEDGAGVMLAIGVIGVFLLVVLALNLIDYHRLD